MRAFKYGLAVVLAIGLDNLSPSLAQTRDANVITPPSVDFPFFARLFGASGYCEVRFNISDAGRPFGMDPYCTNTMFCEAARQGIETAEFSPKLVDGVPEVRRNVVYPLNFMLEGDAPPRQEPLTRCRGVAIS